ncbi:hypothetical protein L810_4549 [Burkholderia sp. AU4i]|nr:hypothetical protein L810_4549 [Burkholderia sp. AU4i]MDW9241965.1 hypothetical protein [Burkholderia cepacia]QOH34361.1 hypothetical protein C7S14_4424 [Burkholderia cepacia]
MRVRAHANGDTDVSARHATEHTVDSDPRRTASDKRIKK